ncbi:hypothetical protein [Pseudoalteromonas mariniglutinosa]|uniref:hypothetical protein n=1 Tax=Pseudoalteromonas mariniglutinosa TaxID=206042 RepID=UPI00384EF063
MDFTTLNKKTSESFSKQRNILKKLAKGQTIHCESCNGVLTLDLLTNQAKQGVVRCQKGCTEVILDLN